MVRIAAVLVSTLIALVLAEGVVRAVDGYRVFSVTLRRTRVAQPTATPDRQHLPAAIAPGVNPEWYELNPPRSQPAAPAPAVAARAQKYATDVYGAFFVWNSVYLQRTLCSGNRFSTFGLLDDFFTFDPADGQQHPAFRHIPHVTPTAAWFTPNNFGWRGPDLTAARSADTIRIAFVGASTTVDPYGYAYSHTELLGHWLQLWARAVKFPYRLEVVNAGRTGIDGASVDAIVRNEVVSVDPDLVISEGANDFNPLAMLKLPPSMPPRPQATFRNRSRAEDYSAVAVRLYDAILKNGQDGSEPRKPDYPFAWPPGVDEHNPDFSRPAFPMPGVVAGLESMRQTLAQSGGELAIAGSIWMVYPGMRLDLSRHLTIFRFLNETYWPVTYAEVRRTADFQNLVYRTFARQHGLAYLPMDEAFPRDPDLFSDAIHMTERGLRLRAWLYLQQLIPVIKARVAEHRWPRPASARPASAAWASEPPRLVKREDILASCPPN
jgi:hypothetical protein